MEASATLIKPRMPIHFLAVPALKATALKIKVLWGHYQAAKKAKKIFDWAAAHAQLAHFEAEYDALLSVPMKDRNPKYDLRTTESGGPAYRKAIRDARVACEQKDAQVFEMALHAVVEDIRKHGH